jgi:putative ABC transport system substrate-binding protein
MIKRIILFALCSLLFAPCSSAEAQQPGKIPRIGVLLPWSPASGVSLSFLKAFREGLHELGYVEGRTFAIEYRYAAGVHERFPELAAELVRLNVDVIVTSAGPPALAAKHATNRLPIVFTQVVDPVEEGLVASLAQPGGNITGLSQIGQELAAKGSFPQDFPCRCPSGISFSRLRSPLQRDAGRGQGDGCSAAITAGAEL